MQRLHITLTIAVLTIFGCSESPTGARNDGAAGREPIAATASIPFELTEFNNIAIQATVNKVNDVTLMFHTANQGVCLIKSATARMANLNLDETGTAHSWGGDTQSRYGTGNSLQIGELEWNDIAIFEDEHSGHHTEGKFGPDLFRDHIFEIDFDKNVINLYDSLPTHVDSFERFTFRMQRGSMFINGQLEVGDQRLDREFMFHSGYGGTVLLDDEFVKNNSIGEQLKTISESEVKDSYGNVLKTKKATLPEFRLGKSTFTKMPIGFFDGAIDRQSMSILGGDLIKRFNVIVDIRNSCLYMKQNSLFDSGFSAS